MSRGSEWSVKRANLTRSGKCYPAGLSRYVIVTPNSVSAEGCAVWCGLSPVNGVIGTGPFSAICSDHWDEVRSAGFARLTGHDVATSMPRQVTNDLQVGLGHASLRQRVVGGGP